MHSFIPLKNLDCMPAYYVRNRKFEYFKDWRKTATTFELEDAMWGCPYQQYLDGYFKEEAANGKILVCGHWTVTDFRHHISNKKWSEDTNIYKFENIIGLDCGVWKYRDRKEYYHPQNVLVIDDKDFKCYNQYGIELKDEELIPRIETITDQD